MNLGNETFIDCSRITDCKIHCMHTFTHVLLLWGWTWAVCPFSCLCFVSGCLHSFACTSLAALRVPDEPWFSASPTCMGDDGTMQPPSTAPYTLRLYYTTQSHSQTQNQLQCDHFPYCVYSTGRKWTANWTVRCVSCDSALFIVLQ